MYKERISRGRDWREGLFKFPTEEGLRKLWIHAIRRDEGKDFQISNTTKEEFQWRCFLGERGCSFSFRLETKLTSQATASNASHPQYCVTQLIQKY